MVTPAFLRHGRWRPGGRPGDGGSNLPRQLVTLAPGDTAHAEVKITDALNYPPEHMAPSNSTPNLGYLVHDCSCVS
jgi:hypothetical protein